MGVEVKGLGSGLGTRVAGVVWGLERIHNTYIHARTHKHT